jgi:CRISPR-associated exonuclease Cas4
MTPVAWVPIAVAGILLVTAGGLALFRRRQQRQNGRLLRADLPSRPGIRLRSPRLRLIGRPDELRELPDGRWLPVEVKSRTSPRAGPFHSHRVQVGAYCLLVEEATGRAPPFGLLRYGDGREFRVEWTEELRRHVLDLRDELGAPYDGRARPSPQRCAGCPWRRSCDQAVL